MDERRIPAGHAEPSVVAEYFATMRRFLETQTRVMSAYLGQDDAAGPPVRAMPALPAPRARIPAHAAVAAMPAPPAASPLPVDDAASPSVADAPAPSPVPPAPVPAAATDAGLAREQLVDLLLGLVEEKTGYPRDMVGLEQNLEADLGIDSIKRIEVVGALLQGLPAHHRSALAADRSKLNTQPNLHGIIELVMRAGAASTPSAAPPVSVPPSPPLAAVTAVPPPRHVMRPRAEPMQ